MGLAFVTCQADKPKSSRACALGFGVLYSPNGRQTQVRSRVHAEGARTRDGTWVWRSLFARRTSNPSPVARAYFSYLKERARATGLGFGVRYPPNGRQTQVRSRVRAREPRTRDRTWVWHSLFAKRMSNSSPVARARFSSLKERGATELGFGVRYLQNGRQTEVRSRARASLA